MVLNWCNWPVGTVLVVPLTHSGAGSAAELRRSETEAAGTVGVWVFGCFRPIGAENNVCVCWSCWMKDTSGACFLRL